MITKTWIFNGTPCSFRDADRNTLVLKTSEGAFPLTALPTSWVNHLMVGNTTLEQFILDNKR